MNQVEIVVSLLIVVAALAIVAKRIALPYPVFLVVRGLVLGFVPDPPPLKLDPEMVLLFVLPPLLYPAALFTSWRDFRANLSSILWLAIVIHMNGAASHSSSFSEASSQTPVSTNALVRVLPFPASPVRSCDQGFSGLAVLQIPPQTC